MSPTFKGVWNQNYKFGTVLSLNKILHENIQIVSMYEQTPTKTSYNYIQEIWIDKFNIWKLEKQSPKFEYP